MKKVRYMPIEERVARRENCSYYVEVSLKTNDGSNKKYSLKTTFADKDLLVARAKAIEMYKNKNKEIKGLKEYEGLPIIWRLPEDENEEDLKTSSAILTIGFLDNNSDANYSDIPISENNDPNMYIAREYSALACMGYAGHKMDLMPIDGVSAEVVEVIYETVENTMRSSMFKWN